MSGRGLTLVAAWPDRQIIGVAVGQDGRTFVSLPRWGSDVDVSVAELGPNGQLRPYPNAEWNRWRNLTRDQVTAGDHWVCVQAIYADARGNLWVLDPGAPAQAALVPGGPKLVQIDLASNRVVRTYAFDESDAPQGSYLNDVRITPDGRSAFITDSGARGAIVVVDLRTGEARRVLDGHPSTQPEPGVNAHVNGVEVRRPDGRGARFAADGIALSPDGWVYWASTAGRTGWRAPVASLADRRLSAATMATRVESIGAIGINDGLWMDARGRLYLTQPEDSAIRVRQPDGRIDTIVQDARLDWPDTFAMGPDGALYVTASHIPEMPWFRDTRTTRDTPSALYRIDAHTPEP